MATTSPPRPRGRRSAKRAGRYHHGHLREALIAEALRTIETRGIDGLTLRSAGAALGVSRTALYRHFADKSALLAAVAGEGFRLLRRELLAAWERAGKGREGFAAMGLAYVEFAVSHPAHYRVMFGGFLASGRVDAELAAESAGAFQTLIDALTAQQREGLVRSDDPLMLARFIWSLVHGIAMLAIDGLLDGPHGKVDRGTLIRYALERGTVATGPEPLEPRTSRTQNP